MLRQADINRNRATLPKTPNEDKTSELSSSPNKVKCVVDSFPTSKAEIDAGYRCKTSSPQPIPCQVTATPDLHC